MMKKIFHSVLLALFISFVALNTAVAAKSANDYTRTLSPQERESLCKVIRSRSIKSSGELSSPGGGIIPDSVLQSIYSSTQNISNATSLVLVLGHALTCIATRSAQKSIKLGPITLATYPNIPVWLAGAIIYFFGFMLTLSITFYLVDIAFKLGFAVIMLPLGIALWPFPPTKNKLPMLISIILKNAAVFVFLGLTVSYALNLLSTAVGDLADVFLDIDQNRTDSVVNKFQLASTSFVIILFALAYGMKLIGAAVEDYADKFFPDNAFGRGQSASPIHGSMTQSMDFAKKTFVVPLAEYTSDVVSTQTGRLTEAVGEKISGNGQGFHGFVGGTMVSVGRKMQQNKKTASLKEDDREKKEEERRKWEKDQDDLLEREAAENARRAEQNNME